MLSIKVLSVFSTSFLLSIEVHWEAEQLISKNAKTVVVVNPVSTHVLLLLEILGLFIVEHLSELFSYVLQWKHDAESIL